MIKLNKRLTTISAFINKTDKVIDIGCDHDLLAIYMYQKEGIKVVGSDINAEPLKIAKANLEKNDLSNTLELRLGDGITTIHDEDTIVISGMGGILITKILDNIDKYNVKKLIISPNDNYSLTRKFITNKGYKIKNETMVNDHSKYYLVSVYVIGNEKTNYFFGKLSNKEKDNIDYFNYLVENNKIIISKLSNKYLFKRLRLKQENKRIIKYLNKK